MTRTKLLMAVLTPLLLLGACGSDEPDATPTGSAPTTPTPIATTEAPTATPPPTSTPPPTVAPTTQAPDPVIDYGEDGVTLTAASDVRKLTGAPDDFKAFMASELERAKAENADACTQKPQINVTKIDVNGWAAGGQFIPQCGGNATLWAKPGGTWAEVWSGQQLTDCATLRKYGFPAGVAGGTCLDGDKEVAYTP